MNDPKFNEELRAKLIAAGYSEAEMQIGALTAEFQAVLKLVKAPFLVTALSNTFSKALAYLSEARNADAERICKASDIIFDAALDKAKEKLSQQPGHRTVMTADLDESPAVDPKDIN